MTSTNSSFVEWTSDFSNDATAEIGKPLSIPRMMERIHFISATVSDSSFKRRDALSNLASAVAIA